MRAADSAASRPRRWARPALALGSRPAASPSLVPPWPAWVSVPVLRLHQPAWKAVLCGDLEPSAQGWAVALALESPGCGLRTTWARRELCCHPHGHAPVLSAAPFPHVGPSVRSGPQLRSFPETHFDHRRPAGRPPRSHGCGRAGSRFQACVTEASLCPEPPGPARGSHGECIPGSKIRGWCFLEEARLHAVYASLPAASILRLLPLSFQEGAEAPRFTRGAGCTL